VTSRAVADQLIADGVLVPFLLLPEHLGGDQRPENVVPVPPGYDEARESFFRMAADGLGEFAYEAVPEFLGDSLVPTVIRLTARADGELNAALRVWGED
jgi:hypothetical protein